MKRGIILLGCCFIWSNIIIGQDITECGETGQIIDDLDPNVPNDPVLSIATISENEIIGLDHIINNVTIDISHTFASDLEIRLISPQGTSLDLAVNLFNADEDFNNTVFQDNGGSIEDGDPPLTGTFRPQGGTFLQTYFGEDTQGDWSLEIIDSFDNTTGDLGSGILNMYCITFKEIEESEIICPENIEIFLSSEEDCNPIINYDDVIATATTNQIIQTEGLISGSAFPVGTTTNTFEVKGNNGTILNCSFDVIVIDDVSPIITCPQNIFISPEEGSTSINLPDFTLNDIGTDNCSIASITQFPLPETSIDINTGITNVLLTAIDENGNSTSCNFNFIIEQSVLPECHGNIVIALDENGEATITSTDVLININGGSIFYMDLFQQIARSDFIGTSDLLLDPSSIQNTGISLFATPALDQNPLTKELISISDTEVIFEDDEGNIFFEVFSFLVEVIIDDNGGLDLIDELCFLESIIENNISPVSITFDNAGILYVLFLNGEINTFNPTANYNQNEFIFIDNQSSLNNGMTNDFENDRLLVSNSDFTTGQTTIIAIDPDTTETNTLITFTPPDNCNGKAIEYVGNNLLIITGDNCETTYSLNLETEEIQILTDTAIFTSQQISDLLFIESNIEDIILSTQSFNCDDIGENLITITNTDNTLSCETIVTIIDPIFIDCPKFGNFIRAEEGQTTITIPDYSLEFSITNSCDTPLTIEQTPPVGTILNAGETTDILIQITDQTGQITSCNFELRTDFSLGTDDISLEQNIILFPNPTKGNITLQNNSNFSLSEIIIYDSTGRIVSTQQMNNTTPDTQISLEKYPNGVYFAQIKTDNASVIRRIIKQ